MTGTRDIAAPREAVWAALNDPEVLRACIPGCTSLTGTQEDGFEAVVTQKVGPVRATFTGAVTLSDVRPLEGYRMSGEGRGGVAGFAKGGADVSLSAIEGGTRLDYRVDATVGGKIAQLGGRLVDSFASKMADQFFERFKDQVEGAGATPANGP